MRERTSILLSDINSESTAGLSRSAVTEVAERMLRRDRLIEDEERVVGPGFRLTSPARSRRRETRILVGRGEDERPEKLSNG